MVGCGVTSYACLFLAVVIDAERWTSECGTSAARGTPTIVNGVQAEYGAFPWHVGVYKNNGTGYYDQICGGTLISEDLVISAAHCFYDERFMTVESASKFMIAAGKYYRPYHWLEPYVQKSPIKTIETAKKYIGIQGNYGADIALIRLEIQLNITELVKPVCIDWDNKYESEQLQNGQMGKVMGWGITEEQETSHQLRELNIPYVPYEQCFAKVPTDFYGYISPTDKFCAGYLNGSSVCLGDSGGGLCFQYGRLWYLRGIVSASPSSNNTDLACDNNQYATFTNVGDFLDWIRAAFNGVGIGTRGLNGCFLPIPPRDGSYEVSCNLGECDPEPGSIVPTNSILINKCRKGYILKGNPASLCTVNGWNSLPTCIKKCRALASINEDIACLYERQIVPCDSPMEPGTMATLACPTFFKISGTHNLTYDEMSCLDNGEWDRTTLQCVPECGEAQTDKKPFFNEAGSMVQYTSFPWDVIIIRKKSKDQRTWVEISGTLIKPDLVVSDAGGTFFFDENDRQYDINNFTVVAGRYFNFDTKLKHFSQYSMVESFNQAKEYNGRTMKSGLALLRLATPFQITKWIRPVCIDWGDRLLAEHLRRGNLGKISANLLKIGGNVDRKTEVDVAYIPRDECLSLIDEPAKSDVSTWSFCANHTNTSPPGTCTRLYPGAGLHFESDGVWYIRGVVHRCIPQSLLPSSSGLGYSVVMDVGNYLGSIRSIYDLEAI